MLQKREPIAEQDVFCDKIAVSHETPDIFVFSLIHYVMKKIEIALSFFYQISEQDEAVDAGNVVHFIKKRNITIQVSVNIADDDFAPFRILADPDDFYRTIHITAPGNEEIPGFPYPSPLRSVVPGALH